MQAFEKELEQIAPALCQCKGYDYQPEGLQVLERVVRAAEQCGARCAGGPAFVDVPRGEPTTDGERAVWAVARGDTSASLEPLSHDAVRDAVCALYHEPRISPACIARVMQALGPARQRELMLGPVRSAMNARATPHKRAVSRERRAPTSDDDSSSGGALARPYCQSCHAMTALAPCATCGVVWYCTRGGCRERDAARHSEWCADLLVSRLLWCALQHDTLAFQNLARRAPLDAPLGAPPPSSGGTPRRAAESWEAFFRDRFDGAAAPPPVERFLLTESLSGPLTVLTTLARHGKLDGRGGRVRVLVVGADCEVE